MTNYWERQKEFYYQAIPSIVSALFIYIQELISLAQVAKLNSPTKTAALGLGFSI